MGKVAIMLCQVNKKITKKAFVGMSGGVDSSVSAALLKEQGFDVTGVFIKVWQPPFMACPQMEDREDAMRVASSLGIRFKTLDLSETYKSNVVDYMIREYEEGRTPNPDIMCNHYVKFGGFYEWAMANDADYVATGHYALSLQDGRLLCSKDENKDQTYFLWKLSSEKLKNIMFPVGSMKKEEVRKYAEKHNLHTASKRDSTGVCFIGEMDMQDFLKHFIKTEEGSVLNKRGEVVGRHEGALLYTMGQRRGFEVTKKSPDEGAHYVIDKNIKSNTITVVSEKEREKQERPARLVELEDINWIYRSPDNNEELKCRYRHRQSLQGCRIELKNSSENKYEVYFAEPQRAVAIGQSLVIYDKQECLGGGIISEVRYD